MGVDLVRGNAAIGQSGGPTAVINQSLAGAVLTLRATLVKKGVVKKVLGMRHGVNGLVREDVLDLTRYPAAKLERIARTPSAALGSSRDKPDGEYCQRIMRACEKLNIRYFFYIGGNDSSDTCRIVNDLAQEAGYELRCFHIPKTIDNDLVGSDHCPGFPSAARFQAMAFAADSLDNASLPGVKINIVMGRNAGFLTGAAALARGEGTGAERNGPHLVCLPEVHFDGDRFVAEIEKVYAKLGRCQVAVSEGVQDSMGRPIVTTLMQGLDKDAHGNVQLSGTGALGDALSDLVLKKLKPAGGKKLRVRSDTFGYIQRAWPDPSPIDMREARGAAATAVRLAAGGERSGSVAIKRVSNRPYRARFEKIELHEVAAKTRKMPPEFIDGNGGVTRKFIEYLKPLVGRLPELERL